jgi:type IX secretion system PorP/SprF family membrane protein
MSDKKGLFSRQQINAQYSYQRKFWDGRLAIGVQAGLLSESFDGSKVDIEDTTDPAFSKSNIKGNSIDFGFGLHYKSESWYAGISAQHLTSPTIELGETNEITVDPTLYATGGYNFKMNNPLFSVVTSAFVATDLVGYRGELSARLIYTYEGRTMSAGLGYSPKNSTTIYLAGSFHGIMLGYSYDIYTSGINFENGSHELFIGYQTDINFMPKGKNRHQSVRHL